MGASGGVKICMTDKMFVDTNLLVYAYDRSEPKKQHQAIVLLEAIVESGIGVISTQVLIEFVSAITRKIPNRLSIADTYSQLEEILRVWPVLEITPLVILEAVRGVRDYSFSIWDAQIWATARLNGIPIVLSEDFQADSVIEGVRFANPFAQGFDISVLIYN